MFEKRLRSYIGFLTARDLGANIGRASTCKTNMAARYDPAIVI